MNHYKYGRSDCGNVELGETYHVALTLALKPEAKIFINKFPEGEDFLKLAGFTDRITYQAPEKKPANLSETGKFLAEKDEKVYEEGSKIWNLIHHKALKDKWLDGIKKLCPYLKTEEPKILIWNRQSTYKPERNLSLARLIQIIDIAKTLKIEPILIGPTPPEWSARITGIIQLSSFYKDPLFQTDNIAKQLFFLDWLHESKGVIGSVGMMSGALDGLAFFPQRKITFFSKPYDCKNRMQPLAKALNKTMTCILLKGDRNSKFADFDEESELSELTHSMKSMLNQ